LVAFSKWFRRLQSARRYPLINVRVDVGLPGFSQEHFTLAWRQKFGLLIKAKRLHGQSADEAK